MNIGELFSVKGRVALVTGGSSGIGRMIATGFAAAGVKVYICARRKPNIEQAAKEIAAETGGDVVGVVADLSSVDGIKSLVAEISSHEKALHILVNNAGLMIDSKIDEYSEESWDQIMDLNLKTPFFLMQQLLPLLRAGGTQERPASIINIGSVGALKVGGREVYAYQASKSAIHYTAKSFAKWLSKDHITVNVIAPGFFPSEMTVIESEQMHEMLKKTVPMGRVGEPEDVAGTAIFLASRAGAYVTGTVIPVEGGLAI